MSKLTVTGRVIDVKRLGHTVYGNPMMSVALDTVPFRYFRISNDSGIVYGIENPEYKETPHIFTLTRAGRIENVQS